MLQLLFGLSALLATEATVPAADCRAEAPAARQVREAAPPGFVERLPDDIKWTPNPAVPGGLTTVLFGDPSKPGPFAIRVRLPPNVRVMPHTHPEARTYTVLAGEWRLGFGERYDAGALRGYPAGSIYRLPPRIAHFQATGPLEAIVQIEGIGPTATDYIDPKHDPRKKHQGPFQK
jgi:hypothetical protein